MEESGLCIPRFEELTPRLLLDATAQDNIEDEEEEENAEGCASDESSAPPTASENTLPLTPRTPAKTQQSLSESGIKVTLVPMPPLTSPPPPAPPTPPSIKVHAPRLDLGMVPMPPLTSPPPPAPPTPKSTPPASPVALKYPVTPERITEEKQISVVTPAWDHLLHRCVKNQRQELVEKLRLAVMALRQRERYLDNEFDAARD